MGETPLAAMGIVVQWSSGVLLLLLFLRLGRSGARPDFAGTWVAAWAAQAVSITGSLIHAIGILLGDPALGVGAVRWLDLLSVPGTLLFAVLAAVGAFQCVCPPITKSVAWAAVATATVLGLTAVFVNVPTVTGSVLIATTVAVFFGLAMVVARAERRERLRRFPLLAAAMVLYGAVTLLYQVGGYFGQLLWPVDDFVTMVGWSAGYGGALASAILGGALIILIVDAAFHGTVAARDDGAVAPLDVVEARATAAFEASAPDPPAAVVPVAAMPEEPAAVIELAAGASPMYPRTATLPRPPVLANGDVAEVLLIDDEAAVRATLARMFQRGGWPVRDVSTGEEGLAWLLDVSIEAAPAVILCDFKMPGMGGREVYAHLMRERPEFLSRLVFVTGDASRESARTFIAGTPCLVVAKPFTLTEIARAVEAVLAALPYPDG